jgi:hemoglobin-like flavoprotein
MARAHFTGEPQMTPAQKDILEATWQQIVPIADQAATMFYNRLFEIDPALRPMFAGTDMAAQRRKLVEALSLVLGTLDDLEALVPVLEELGRRHVAYGVTEAHYGMVGEALLWTLEQGLADAWSPAAANAWALAYGFVAGTMQRGAVTGAAIAA